MVDGKDVNILTTLDGLLTQYRAGFSNKVYSEENNEHDVLMDVFGITPELKRENRQYWGRELGMCFQRLVCSLCESTCPSYASALRFGSDEPCDLVVGKFAIDTKYRIGSGDSGTLKKFKAYGPLLRGKGLVPVLLVLRKDNLPAAITACERGGWEIYTGEETMAFLLKLTGFNLGGFLQQRAKDFRFERV